MFTHVLDRLSRERVNIVLPAGNGCCTVVMNKSEYKNKSEIMLQDFFTYKKLKKRQLN